MTQLSCKAQDPDDTRAPSVHAYTFAGSVEPRFVGEWHTNPDMSTLDMHKDGSVDIVAVLASPSGRVSKKLKGSWAVSGSDLLLKYDQPSSGSPIVLKYKADLSGDTLKVVQAGSGLKSTYLRKHTAELSRK